MWKNKKRIIFSENTTCLLRMHVRGRYKIKKKRCIQQHHTYTQKMSTKRKRECERVEPFPRKRKISTNIDQLILQLLKTGGPNIEPILSELRRIRRESVELEDHTKDVLPYKCKLCAKRFYTTDEMVECNSCQELHCRFDSYKHHVGGGWGWLCEQCMECSICHLLFKRKELSRCQETDKIICDNCL